MSTLLSRHTIGAQMSHRLGSVAQKAPYSSLLPLSCIVRYNRVAALCLQVQVLLLFTQPKGPCREDAQPAALQVLFLYALIWGEEQCHLASSGVNPDVLLMSMDEENVQHHLFQGTLVASFDQSIVPVCLSETT